MNSLKSTVPFKRFSKRFNTECEYNYYRYRVNPFGYVDYDLRKDFMKMLTMGGEMN